MLWPENPKEYIEELIHALTYQMHGGSGMTWTRADVLDLYMDEAERAIDRLGRQREKEAAAIKRAGKR